MMEAVKVETRTMAENAMTDTAGRIEVALEEISCPGFSLMDIEKSTRMNETKKEQLKEGFRAVVRESMRERAHF